MRCVALVYRLLVFVTLCVWHAGLYVSLSVLCFVSLLLELICVYVVLDLHPSLRKRSGSKLQCIEHFFTVNIPSNLYLGVTLGLIDLSYGVCHCAYVALCILSVAYCIL